ncbi:MAG: hypothetical protein HY689_02470 [Chloroflexi bacterium]|nr:hypothetical protein [Chloroflexota bacterium]
MRSLLTTVAVGLVLWALLQSGLLLVTARMPSTAGLVGVGVLGLLGALVFLGLRGALPALPGSRERTAYDADNDAAEDPAAATAVAQRLEGLLPTTSAFYQVRLRRKFWGWICTATSRIPSLPWQYQVYTWGQRPDVEKIARMLVGPLQWFTPQAKAHQLAEQILGREGMQRILAGTFFLPSRLSPAIEYRFTPYSLILYRDGRPMGSFCLQPRGRFPLWDVVLSRVLMVAGSELEFLRTAHFYGPVPPYFAVPMTREQFAEIYGKEALEKWDTCTSSILGRAIVP